MFDAFRKPNHLVSRGMAILRNPYRRGDVTHPSTICHPESNRDASDSTNLHTVRPKGARRA